RARDVFAGRRRHRRGECRRRAEGPRLLSQAGLGHRPDQGERRDRHVVCAKGERRARPLSAEVAVTVLAKPAETVRRSNMISIAGVELEMLERGHGAPLLYLHGGAGIALDAPFIDLLARERRIIAPSHPGFGRSSLPDWLDSVDDIAHIYLELMDRLGLKRTDVVGLSIGGWIAAELATKVPERFGRLVLIGPVGAKTGRPDKLDVPDVFALPQDKLDRLRFHDPAKNALDLASIPADDLHILAPSPQPRDAGAVDLGAVHAQSQAQASAPPGERSHAVSAWRERRHRLRRVSRALCGAHPAGADRDHCGGRTLAPCGAADRDGGERVAFLAGRASGRDVRSKIMKAWHFSENAYPYLPPADEYESIRVSLPNRIYDPKKGAALYDRYIDEWLVAEDEGVEIMLNEHHQTATCVDP